MDGKGLEGVEFFYDSHLRGTDTSVKVLRDAHGTASSRTAGGEDASGKNLVLTLDQSISSPPRPPWPKL